MKLTREELHNVLRYDPSSGEFTWLIRPSPTIDAGDVAGKINSHGYKSIKIGRHDYTAHRLAWLYMTGTWPTKNLDHADGDRTNNAWSNLRECEPTQNGANRPVQRNNKTGFKGVCFNARCGKYQAAIRGGKGIKRHLGLFETADEAAHAYNRAAIEIHGEFARLNPVGVPNA